MKYNLIIGKFAPFNNFDRVIVESFIKNNKPVCIAIMASEEKWSVSRRMMMIKTLYEKEMSNGLLKLISLPDIFEENIWIQGKNGVDIVIPPEVEALIKQFEIYDKAWNEVIESRKRGKKCRKENS